MSTKRAAKGVSLSASKRKPDTHAVDKLPDNATEAEIRHAVVSESLVELEDRVADVRDSWETESLFEDVFDELTAETTAFDGMLFSSTRVRGFRRHLGTCPVNEHHIFENHKTN